VGFRGDMKKGLSKWVELCFEVTIRVFRICTVCPGKGQELILCEARITTIMGNARKSFFILRGF
jgi:hypothetical protein